MVVAIAAAITVAFVALVVRNTFVTLGRLRVELAKVEREERDDSEWEVLIARQEKLEQDIRDTNSRISMSGLR